MLLYLRILQIYAKTKISICQTYKIRLHLNIGTNCNMQQQHKAPDIVSQEDS